MNVSLDLELVRDIVIQCALCLAFCGLAYAVLQLWAWWYAVLAALCAYAVTQNATVQQAGHKAYDLATTGAAKALDWFAAKRSALSK